VFYAYFLHLAYYKNIYNGSTRFLPLVLSLTSLILSILANTQCNLMKPDAWDLYPWDFSIWEPNNAPDALGLWCLQTNGGQKIRYNERDPYTLAARGFGTTVLVLGSLFMIVYLVAAVKPSVVSGGKLAFVLGVACIVTCCLFQGLVFLIFKVQGCPEFGCSLDTGGKIGIAACVGWFLTGIASMMLVGLPAKEDEEEPAATKEEEEEPANEGGET
jgi:uncharacterized membrane protein YhdT